MTYTSDDIVNIYYSDHYREIIKKQSYIVPNYAPKIIRMLRFIDFLTNFAQQSNASETFTTYSVLSKVIIYKIEHLQK